MSPGRPAPIRVERPDDPRVADYVGLRDPDLRRRVEAAGAPDAPHGRLIVEGAVAIARLLGSPHPVRSVLASEARVVRDAALLARVPADVPIYEASRAVLDAVAGFPLHRGLVASAARLAPASPGGALAGARVAVIVEGVADHENVGAIFRNAAALGARAVLLDPTAADPLYRRSVRVSLGHVLTTPFARAEPWPAALAAWRAGGWRVLALTPARDATPLPAVPGRRRGERGLAVMVGAEGPGLSQAALAAADARVRIPMAPGADSLNVATAVAVALHRLCDPEDAAGPG